jgi:ssDNA-specific exonuclease RecJ
VGKEMEINKKLDIFSSVNGCVTLLILHMDKVFVGIKVVNINHGHINLGLATTLVFQQTV